MRSSIEGPDGINPGDQVDYNEHGRMRTKTTQVTVVKASASGLTVRLPDGTEVRRAYTAKVKSGVWGGGTSIHHNFSRLDAHDLWRRARPVSDLFGHDGKITIKSNLLRDNPTAVFDELAAIAAWLKLEPARSES